MTKFLTNDSQNKSGQRINAASNIANASAQVMMLHHVNGVKEEVSRVYTMSCSLQTAVRPSGWNGLSTTSVKVTLTAKGFLSPGVLNSLASCLNFLSVINLGTELDNLRHGLQLLRNEAMVPINAYKEFETRRQNEIQDILDKARNKLISHREIGHPSLFETYYYTREEITGSKDESFRFNFKKAAIGLGIGLVVSFASASYVMYKLNDNQPAPTKEPTHHQLENNR